MSKAKWFLTGGVGTAISGAGISLHAVGDSPLTGDIALAAGPAISVTQTGQQITIESLCPSPVTSLQGTTGDVELAGDGIVITNDGPTIRLGLDGSKLVASMNGLNGAVNLVPGDNVSIVSVGNGQLKISASAPAGGSGGSGGGSLGVADRATFFAGFGSPILPGSDLGTRHIITRSSRAGAIYAYLREPPSSGNFVFDLECSQDSGATWASILMEPLIMAAGATEVLVSSNFVDGGFAPGNLLRLVVNDSGGGPGFANGFSCALRLDGAVTPGWDKATFALGLNGNVPIGVDLGAYYIPTHDCTPGVLYCTVNAPPSGADAHVDIQVLQNGVWNSIFPPGAPFRVADSTTSVVSTSSFSMITIRAGQMMRPIFIDGPQVSGTGYNISLELEII